MVCRRPPERASAPCRAVQSRAPRSGLTPDYVTLVRIAASLDDASTTREAEVASTLTLLPKQRERESTGGCQVLLFATFLTRPSGVLGSRSPVTRPCRNHTSPQVPRTSSDAGWYHQTVRRPPRMSVVRASEPPEPDASVIRPGLAFASSPRLSPRPRRTEPSDGHLSGTARRRPTRWSVLPASCPVAAARTPGSSPPAASPSSRRGPRSTARPPTAWSNPTPTGP